MFQEGNWKQRPWVLPLGNCMCALGHTVVSDPLPPHGLSPPDSSVHGIFQARIECVAISFSRRSSWPREQTCFSCIGQVHSLPLTHLGSHRYKYPHIGRGGNHQVIYFLFCKSHARACPGGTLHSRETYIYGQWWCVVESTKCLRYIHLFNQCLSIYHLLFLPSSQIPRWNSDKEFRRGEYPIY